jgi:hypothetical protein
LPMLWQASRPISGRRAVCLSRSRRGELAAPCPGPQPPLSHPCPILTVERSDWRAPTPSRGSAEDILHRLRFPLPAPRCGDAAPVESGGDLSERLRAGSLNLWNDRQDGVCMRFGPRYTAGVDGGGRRLGEDCPASDLWPLRLLERPSFGRRSARRVQVQQERAAAQRREVLCAKGASGSESDGGTRLSFPSIDQGREVFQPNAVVGLCHRRASLPAHLRGPCPAECRSSRAPPPCSSRPFLPTFHVNADEWSRNRRTTRPE